MKFVLTITTRRFLPANKTEQRLRPLAYAKAHVILIAYAVDTPDSLENVTNKVRCFCSFFYRNTTNDIHSGLKRPTTAALEFQ